MNFKGFLSSLMVTISLSAAPSFLIKDQDLCPNNLNYMRTTVRNIEAGGIGYNKGYTTLEAFIAQDPFEWSVMPFVDLRGHIMNDGYIAANIGLGARWLKDSRIYGTACYYDLRRTHHKKYNQFTVALETLGSFWDLRMNGYFPFGTKVSHPWDATFSGFQGNSVLVSRKFEYAMTGFDLEMGFHFAKWENFDFYSAVGPYYFKGHMGSGAIGAKARIAAYYKQYVSFELSDSWDNVFHNNVQGQIALTLPFGPSSTVRKSTNRSFNTCQKAVTLTKRMIQPVNRQEIIVANTKNKKQAAENFILFVNNLSHSLGTFESPYPTLLEAQNNSSPNDIIYVFAGDGTTTGMDAGITLQNGQKLWGSSTSHSLATNLGTISIPNQTTQIPAITHTDDHAIILASGNEVSGFNISGTGVSVVYGVNPGDFSLTDCVFTHTDNQYVIDLTFSNQNGRVTLDNNQYLPTTNLSGITLRVDGSSSVTARVSNSTFSGLNIPLNIDVEPSASLTMTFLNNTWVNNTGYPYIYSSGDFLNLNFTNNQFITNTDQPFLIDILGPSNIAIRNNYFIDNDYYADINISGTSISQLVFDGNISTGNGRGVAISSAGTANLTATISNNTFSGNSVIGLDIQQSANSNGCYNIYNNRSTANGTDYQLTNASTGVLNITPCDAENVNTPGLFDDTTGTITSVSSCTSGVPCE